MHLAISPRLPDMALSIASNLSRAKVPSTFFRVCSRSDSSSESVE